MMLRRPVILTSMQEDFRKIGLLSEDEHLDEVDDPENPRDIPSPDPSAMGGLDNSAGGGNSKAKHSTARQPKPAMSPSDSNDHEDPLAAGGAQKGKLRNASHKAGDMREGDSYKDAGGQILPKANDQGKRPDTAQGLKPVRKHAGMKSKSYGENAFDRALGILDEVGDIMRGLSISEEMNHILRGTRLVAENSALLADRMTEISEVFEVEDSVLAMEELSEDAAELYGIIEANLDGHSGEEEEERAAVRNSKAAHESRGSDRNPVETYDIPSPAFKEQVEEMLGVMVSEFMEHLKAYDTALSAMSEAMDDDDDDDDDDDEDEDKGKKSKSKRDDADDSDEGNGKGRMGGKFAEMRSKFRGNKG